MYLLCMRSAIQIEFAKPAAVKRAKRKVKTDTFSAIWDHLQLKYHTCRYSNHCWKQFIAKFSIYYKTKLILFLLYKERGKAIASSVEKYLKQMMTTQYGELD